MNLNDANRIHDAAPDDCDLSMQDDDFCVIMELTKEEKRELLLMWAERIK